VLTGCPTGRSNCDGNDANGCETDHAAAANSCGTATDLGSRGGDKGCNWPGCGTTSWAAFGTLTGTRSRWIKARATECSACCADVEHAITLAVPADANYDLYVYASCGNPIGESRNAAGQSDGLVIYVSDGCLAEDSSFDYWVEVRWESGQSCSEWTLTLDGKSCTC
jgi:hypothetical protein